MCALPWPSLTIQATYFFQTFLELLHSFFQQLSTIVVVVDEFVIITRAIELPRVAQSP